MLTGPHPSPVIFRICLSGLWVLQEFQEKVVLSPTGGPGMLSWLMSCCVDMSLGERGWQQHERPGLSSTLPSQATLHGCTSGPLARAF